MHATNEFLRNLALVLCVAAITTQVFQRLRQPVVFGYMLAGLIVGPHIPVPLVADEAMVHTFAELGVVLLMFALGLEFSLRRLVQVGPTAGIVALLQSALMVALGYLIGRAFGWTAIESVYAGAIIAISSTTIIVKAFAEQGVKGKVTEVVFGVLIIEDLIAIFLLAILTTLSSGGGISAGHLGLTAGRLVAFLAGLLVVGLFVVPRLIRSVVKLDRPETIIVTAVGLCFGIAYLASVFGYSVALGAFVAGSLVAESGREKVVEHLIAPVRDMFAAIFFVAVGMMIDPRLILEHWGAILIFSIIVIVGKVIAVTIGAFLAGYGTRTSVSAGMSLAQIGEFSFIIAGVGLTTGATRDFLYPVAVAVSAITTLTTPALIRAADRTASLVDRRLPKPIQNLAALYGSWIEGLRQRPANRGERSRERRLLAFLVLDAVIIAALALVATRGLASATAWVSSHSGIGADNAKLLVLAGCALAVLPLAIGLLRGVRALALRYALRAFPPPAPGRVDFAAAPRRAFVVSWQLALVILGALPLFLLLQTVVHPAVAVTLLGLGTLTLGIGFWRSATNLQAHTRAGAEVIIAALGRQMEGNTEGHAAGHGEASTRNEGLPSLKLSDLVPGLGDPVSVRLAEGDHAVGRTLAELDLRDRTDAAVLAISRERGNVLLPVGRERLEAGDLLALAGTHEAIVAARHLLSGREP